MSNKDTNAAWGGDWLDMQRQLLDGWLSLSQLATKSGVTPGPYKNPLTENMDQWWKLVSPSLSGGSKEFIGKVTEQGKVLYMLSEHFTKLLNNINSVNQASEDWQTALNTQFEEMKTLFTNTQGQTHETLHGMMGAWQQLPLDTLRRTFSSASFMPGDFLEDLKPHALDDVTDKFLSIPGVGYTRESQEQAQVGIRLWNDYLKVCGEYNSAMSKVSIDALNALRMKIVEMAEQGKEINSLRQIYDLWVDCNEDAYAKYTSSEGFSVLYGRLTNALMAVKHHGRNVVDEALGGLNMPTRRGMNSVLKRQQEMRREQREADKKIEELQRKVSSLRKHIEADKPANNRAPVKSPAVATRPLTAATTRRPRLKNIKKKTSAGRRAASKGAKKDDMIIIKI